MKLIDILVQELPKRGCWPAEAFFAMQDSDGLVKFSKSREKIYHDYSDGHGWASEGGYDWIRDGYPFEGDFKTRVAKDNETAFIAREQYEAALAASKQVWNGEGLPTVGCRVETRFNGEWVEATVAYTGRPETSGAADTCKWKEALVFDCKTTRPFWADEFRPIRSEEDKKRDAACDAMHKWWREVAGQEREDGSLIDIYSGIYDAIAAGNIPGIRIE